MEKLEKIIVIILITVVLVIAVSPIIYVVSLATKLVEQEECYNWAKMAKEKPDFYLLDWQEWQCDSYDIEIFEEAVWEN